MDTKNHRQQSTFVITGLCCATEESLIRKKLASLQGIEEMQFNLVSHKLTISHTIEERIILQSLSEIGLPGQPLSVGKPEVDRKTPQQQLISTIVSGVLFLGGLVLSWTGGSETLTTAIFMLSILTGGWKIAVKAGIAVRHLTLDMNILMTSAVLGAVAIGEFAEGAAVIFLFAVSLLLESLSIDRSRRAIQSLLSLSPLTATLKDPAGSRVLPLQEIPVGSIIEIRPGERIPLDGRIVSGVSTVDQSAVTGESIPLSRQTGDPVFAGTFNQRGALEVQTTATAEDSTIAKIIHMVEEAQNKKAPRQTFVEQFARRYTPSVFGAALVLMIVPPLFFGAPFEEWFYRSLVLLVIACPCALVISTPVSIMSALTSAARNGVLIKGGKHLELLAGVRAVALDKTGTLTAGTPTVTDIIHLDSLSPEEILRIAAAMELRSEHHLADAFLRKAKHDGIDLSDMNVEAFDSVPGKGVRAIVNGKPYMIGNHPLVEELGLCSPRLESVLGTLERQGKTVVVLTDETGPLGVIGIADRLREESRHSVESLRRLGIERVVLLTGDNPGTAQSVAEELGVDEVRAELLPDQKLEAIGDLKKRFKTVAMVGDGVNDAPALAAADVGIAMGGAGSDTALETADVVLMSDNLSKLPFTIHLGSRALAIIRQNVAIALITKAFFLVLGVLGMTSLWLAILADDGATLVVILNSLRLLRSTEP